MGQKRLIKSEIEYLAVKIINEVNEVNKLYNDTVKASKTYKDDIKAIEDKNPILEAQNKLITALKIEFGTDYTKHVNFSLHEVSNSTTAEKASKARREITEYNDKVLKKIHSVQGLPNDKYYKDNNKLFQDIVAEITISQITVSDIHLLVNSIKARLI